MANKEKRRSDKKNMKPKKSVEQKRKENNKESGY